MSGTIIYPENEALRYVIAEQRKRIEELERELAIYRGELYEIEDNQDSSEERVKGM